MPSIVVEHPIVVAPGMIPACVVIAHQLIDVADDVMAQ
jgi:hypothetical protein